MPNNILQGDVIEKLKEIETGTVQCVVTSPPYWGLRDYQTASWEGGDESCDHSVAKINPLKVGGFTGERLRKEGGTENEKYLKYKNRCSDCGAVKKDQQLGLEETPEEYVEKMVEVFRQIKRVLKHDGTVWLNLGDSYAGSGRGGNPPDSKWSGFVGNDKREKQAKEPTKVFKGNGYKAKDLIGIPWRVAFALQADGWYLRQDIIWHKPNPMPESVTDRCTKSHEYIFLLTKSAKYFYDNDAIKERTKESTLQRLNQNINKQSGSYTPSKGNGNMKAVGDIETGRNKRSVWKINTQPYKEAHFAVFPPELPELCIKAGSSEGDIVLDPFFGSGTTGWVAQRLGRKWIGIELNEEYIKIAEKRFKQQELFVAQ